MAIRTAHNMHWDVAAPTKYETGMTALVIGVVLQDFGIQKGAFQSDNVNVVDPAFLIGMPGNDVYSPDATRPAIHEAVSAFELSLAIWGVIPFAASLPQVSYQRGPIWSECNTNGGA